MDAVDVGDLALARLLVNATVAAVSIGAAAPPSLNASGADAAAGDVDATGLPESVEPHENRPETYFVPVLFALIFIVGVLGNGTLVLVFARDPKMRNVPNTYIFRYRSND